jgi:uncharacterized membrane protein
MKPLSTPVLLAPLAVSVIATAVAWQWLPDPMPIHWGIDGQPDGWASRLAGAGLGPVIHYGVITLIQVLRHADPRQENIAQSAPALDAMVLAISAFMAGMQGLILYASVSAEQRINEALLFVLLGGLFFTIGAVMPGLRPNHMAGIRVSWTLNNDRIWHKTHVLGGKLFMAAGALTAVAGVLTPMPWAVGVMMATTLIAGFAPMYYAWRLSRRADAP